MTLDWQSAYDQKLRELPSVATFKAVMDCVWLDGILAHISPENPEAFAKREEEKRPVWHRDGPVMYWRILYTAYGAAGSYRENWQFRDAIVTWPIALAGMRRQGLNAELCGNEGMLKGIDVISRRAEAQLRELRETPHRIPYGARGTFKELKVVVQRYTSYGEISLHTDEYHYKDGDYKAWQRLGEIALFGLVEPSVLNPADFTTKYGESL